MNGLAPALLILAAATLITALNIYFPFTDLVPLIWVGAILISGLSIASGVRQFQREGIMDPAIEAILPHLAANNVSRDLVQPLRWTKGWVGTPSRIRIRYAAQVVDDDPRFIEQILGALERRLGGTYQIRKHDPRKCVVIAELAPVSEPVSREHQRAIDVIKQLVDSSASINIVEGPDVDDDGNPKLDADGKPRLRVKEVEVKHNVGAKMASVPRRLGIEKTVNSMLPGRWRTKWNLEEDIIKFQVRPQMPDMIKHTVEGAAFGLNHAKYKQFTIPIGIDEDGIVQHWQPSVSPHCLVIGGTGSGKTSFQHTVLTHLSHAGWRIWVIDGKRIEFTGFREWPNVELVGARVEHQVRMLHAAHELMEERYSLLESGQARLEDFEPLAIIIDEYATFKARVQRWYKSAGVKPKGAPAQAPVLELLSDLARLARSAKIHMLLGLQRPDVEFLGGEMRDNFGARVSFGRLSPQGANMMWDSFAIGVAIPRNKRGRGVTLNAESQPVEIQAYYTPDPAKLDSTDEEEFAHLATLRPAEARYGRSMIVDPEPSYADEDMEVPIDPDYYQWLVAKIGKYDPEFVSVVTPPAPSNVISLTSRDRVRFVEDEPDDIADDMIVDSDDGYLASEEGPAADLQVGDLISIDLALDLWGVIEGVEPDVVDDEQLAIEYRDLESGEDGLLTVADNEVLTYRHPQDA